MAAALSIGVLLLATGLFWMARRYPNPSKRYPGAIRMPRFVVVFGWVIAIAGVMMALAAFTTGDSDGEDQTLAMRIASICTTLLGLLLLVLYRNFWVRMTTTAIDYRGAFTRKRKHIPLNTVTRVGAARQNGALMAIFISPEETFTLNTSVYDATAALDELWRLDVPMDPLLHQGRAPRTI